jgi:hypothetical protein
MFSSRRTERKRLNRLTFSILYAECKYSFRHHHLTRTHTQKEAERRKFRASSSKKKEEGQYISSIINKHILQAIKIVDDKEFQNKFT